MATSAATSPPSQPEAAVLRFGAFELDLRDEELRRSGVQVRLQAQPFKVLALLARRPGELVRREEIQEHVWGTGTHVDFEQGINVCIGQIRQALGDQAQAPRFLETVPRKGYRFVAPVEHVPEPGCEDSAGEPEETEPAAATHAVPTGDGAQPSGAVPPAEDSSTSRRSPRSWPPAWWVAGAVGLLVTAAAVTGLLVWGEARPSAGGSDPATGSSAAGPSDAGPGAASVPRLLVLPFEHYGSEVEGGHLADGLTEEVITELVRGYGARLGVIARTTAMRYRGTSKSVAEIAAELGVDWVVEGSVRRDGDRVRVTAQLVGADDLHRWANEYDRELRRERLADLELQATVSETIARAVALNLGLEVSSGTPGTPSAPTVPEAHQAYLEGLGLLPPGAGADPSGALAAFRRTVELDPGFAAGWLGVATALGSFPTQAQNRRLEERRAALERALALDESLPDAHRRLALLRFYYDWDPEGARASWQRALELAPHFAEAHHDFAAYWSVTGRHDRALASVDRALSLDPGSPGVTSDVGWYSYFARRWEEAQARCRETLELEPGYFWAEECLFLAAVAAGDLETAHARARATVHELRDRPERPEGMEQVLAAVEDPDPARGLEAYLRWDVERLEAAWRAGRFFAPYQIAVRHMMRGDGEAALDWLERAARQRRGWILPFLPVHPLFDPLRDEPRFEEMVRRISGEDGLRLSRRQP